MELFPPGIAKIVSCIALLALWQPGKHYQDGVWPDMKEGQIVVEDRRI